MTTRRRLSLLALALPAWIVMILAGGRWCLMPESASVRLVAERGIPASTTSPKVARAAHAAYAGHVVQLAEAESIEHASTPVPHRSHHSGDTGACATPTACNVAVASTRVSLGARAARPTRPAIAAVDRPTSVALAPELPPPRA